MLFMMGLPVFGAENSAKVAIDWNKVTRISRTTPTLQVVVNPPLRRWARKDPRPRLSGAT